MAADVPPTGKQVKALAGGSGASAWLRVDPVQMGDMAENSDAAIAA
jgi:hypothetical protein